MSAAATTTGPALVTPGQPIRTWQVRRNEEVVLQVWRVIANASPKGISAADIRTRLNDIAQDVLKQHLHELRRKGHARFDSPTGSTRVGVWVCTDKLPGSEHPPLWMQHAGESTDSAAEQNAERAVADATAMTANAAVAVPNSVFALGTPKLRSFGVDIDGAHMPASHKQALADAAPPAAEPATAQQPDADPGPELDAAEEAAGPLFALYSDKTLGMVLARDRVMVLNQDETRALFAYLDSLMAISHGSLSEAAS